MIQSLFLQAFLVPILITLSIIVLFYFVPRCTFIVPEIQICTSICTSGSM